MITNKVKEFRTKQHLTQVDLAKAVNISSRTIISMEAQKYNPTLDLAFKIAEVLNTTVLELFEYKGDE